MGMILRAFLCISISLRISSGAVNFASYCIYLIGSSSLQLHHFNSMIVLYIFHLWECYIFVNELSISSICAYCLILFLDYSFGS